MHYQTVLREARRVLLEDFVLGELSGLVDYRTGEILSQLNYETVPYHPHTDEVPPTFAEVYSVAGLSRFMEHIDKRRLVLSNQCRRLYDIDKGRYHYSGNAIRFTNQQLDKMNALAKRLDYGNSIVSTPTELAKYLRIHRNHLYRYLGSLGSLVRVITPARGMAQGSLRVDISPAYGFRHFSADLEQARSQAITSWYRPIMQ